VNGIVVTVAQGNDPTRQHATRRIGFGKFVAGAVLAHGKNTITVVAHTGYGARLRAVVVLDVPG
jgi:hypothetical protein